MTLKIFFKTNISLITLYTSCDKHPLHLENYNSQYCATNYELYFKYPRL